MKRDKILSLENDEYEKFVSTLAPRKAPSFWKMIVQRASVPWRRFRSYLRSSFWFVKMRAKKHYHLHLLLQNEEKHWRVNSIFHSQSRKAREPKQVTGMLETLPRRLTVLRKKMKSVAPDTSMNHRKYRGEFVRIVRDYRGLSREQTCRLLNSHRELSVFARRHPSYWHEFPFTPTFIEKFENHTETIVEEFTQGFLFGAGFPTEDFARWLSEIYCADKEFEQFKKWYAMLPSKNAGH